MSSIVSNNISTNSNIIFHDHSYCKRPIDQLSDSISPTQYSKRKLLERSVIPNICHKLFLLFLFQLSELEMEEDLSVKSLTQSPDVKLFNCPMESSFVCELKNTFSNVYSYVNIVCILENTIIYQFLFSTRNINTSCNIKFSKNI